MGCQIKITTTRKKLYRNDYTRDSWSVIRKCAVGSNEICELICVLIQKKRKDDLDDEEK